MHLYLTKHPFQSSRHPYADEKFYADWLKYSLPKSWNFNELILGRLRQVERAFTSGSMTGDPIHWLFSSEIEFRIQDCSMAAAPPRAKGADRIRYIDEARAVLHGQLTDDPDYNRIIQDRILQLHFFDVRDLILFNIHEDCKDIVEFRFGPQEHGVGYYDNPGVAEIRLLPVPAEQFIINYHRLIDSIYANTARMTSITPDIKRNHINFSPNLLADGEYKSLIEQKDRDPAAKAFVRKVFAGILRSFHDGGLATHADVDHGDVKIDLGTSRGHIFRMARNRAEYRLGEGDKDHMANYVLKILGGAAYGLSAPDTRLPRTVRCGMFIDKNAQSDGGFSGSFYAARVLQGCVLRGNGRLGVPAGYLSIRKDAIEQELLGPSQGSNVLGSFLGECGEQDITLLKRLFERVRVGPGGALDLSGLRNWPNASERLTEVFEKDTGATCLDLAIQRLAAIDCRGMFTTIASAGHKQRFSAENWEKHLLDFYKSPVNRAVYGDDFVDGFIAMIAPDAFRRSFMIGDKTRPGTLSVEKTMRQATGFLAAIPLPLAAGIADAFREKMDKIQKWNEDGIRQAAKYAGEGDMYWRGVHDRRVKIGKGFLTDLSGQINNLADTYAMQLQNGQPKAIMHHEPGL